VTTDTLRAELDRAMSESDWQRQIVDFAGLRGWKHIHYRPAMTNRGWRTALSGDPGAPDLLMVRDRLILVECKSERGRLSPTQVAWQEALKAAGAESYVWKPSDWPEVERLLS